ncbi:DUF706-domain-containing protein [Saccharata proteae CBS 121410]|uniref:Inositol oxygenase n=1 Tax=Saccharata proteae CBS 121410 TaxID=1314787 RepID=A0A9P4M0K8_9PEZI|nr:DUF706-domain-containing protein [Saccharata proteae CBS 121410]
MAPAAIVEHGTAHQIEQPNINENFNDHRDGLALETLSDDIDEVNVLKAALKVKQGTASGKEKDIYDKSQFDAEKDKTQFRQYEDACDRVKNFYREQHEKQTVAYNLKARNDFKSKTRAEMTIWQAMEKLNTLIDESDPDTSLSQIEHLLQAAEAIRADGKPRWMQLTGLIHDLGKLLFFFDARGQWDVVGDTFPVGCAFDKRIIYPETFKGNPDHDNEIYSTKYGIYSPGCGLDNVMLSWGHDEYLYHIAKEQSTLPDEALAMIRYHSFYPWHSAGAYRWMMNEKDEKMLAAVKAFNPYDLYSKSDGIPKVENLKDYYMELIDEYFPDKVVKW